MGSRTHDLAGAPLVIKLDDDVRALHVLGVGAGVVGGATGLALRNLGHHVRFADIDDGVVERLRAEGLEASHMANLDLADVDLVLVSVQTPTFEDHADLRSLEAAIADIGEALGRAAASEPDRYRVVVVRSTIPPGTTEDSLIPLLETRSGLRAGEDFGVSMTPEYLRHWNAHADAAAPRAIVIGELDERSGDLVERLVAPLGRPIHRMPIRAAEFHKYVHNLANATKISFFNELREVAASIGVDAGRVFGLVTDTAEGLWNAAYGTLDLGSFEGCLSKDLRAFLSWAAERGLELPVASGAEGTNRRSERG